MQDSSAERDNVVHTQNTQPECGRQEREATSEHCHGQEYVAECYDDQCLQRARQQNARALAGTGSVQHTAWKQDQSPGQHHHLGRNLDNSGSHGSILEQLVRQRNRNHVEARIEDGSHNHNRKPSPLTPERDEGRPEDHVHCNQRLLDRKDHHQWNRVVETGCPSQKIRDGMNNMCVGKNYANNPPTCTRTLDCTTDLNHWDNTKPADLQNISLSDPRIRDVFMAPFGLVGGALMLVSMGRVKLAKSGHA